MDLPSLDNLAYPAGDDGDHPGGGHCASLGGGTREENRLAMVDQYGTALRVLVDAAEASGDGWGLSRPILFAVHQLCENALDLANDRARATVSRSGKHRHSLAVKMAGAVAGRVYDYLTPDERRWCERFVEQTVPLTGNGFPGRFADGTVSGRSQLDDIWCCINPAALRDAALMFAGLTLLSSSELEESAVQLQSPANPASAAT